jgi:hypothetical protein
MQDLERSYHLNHHQLLHPSTMNLPQLGHHKRMLNQKRELSKKSTVINTQGGGNGKVNESHSTGFYNEGDAVVPTSHHMSKLPTNLTLPNG